MWYLGGYQQTSFYNQPPNTNGNPTTILNGHYFTQPAGTSDDGRWHHFAATRSTATNGQKLYLDGQLVIQGDLRENPVSYDTDTTFTLGTLSPGHWPTSFTDARIDRLRIHSKMLSQAEITALYHQDIDRDGLWYITETSTLLWRDLNSDGQASVNEQQFSVSPFTWQFATSDSDDDELPDIDEQSLGTIIDNPDSDGDLIPDGWEQNHGLNPLNPADASLDPDTDGLTNVNEYRYNTHPGIANTDGDSKNDGPEVAQGSNPTDPSDGGNPIPAAERVSILLGIGDQSGSESEDYVLHCYHIDSETGQENRIYTLRSGGFGQYQEETQSFFRKGETYTFQIDWQSSSFNVKAATPGNPAEGPDYDYTFKVQSQGDHGGTLVDSWNKSSATFPVLATDASNVADTETEFKQNYENKRVALVSPKLEWLAPDGYDNIDTHTDPWAGTAKGRRIFPGFKDPASSQLRHAAKLVVKGGLQGIPVYIKSFDVDDGTFEGFDHVEGGSSPIIDTNGPAGDDNLPDYLGTAKAGHFWTGAIWGGSEANKNFDATGKAEFYFRVGMQPGNNYRVLASVSNADGLASAQTGNPAANTYVGPELAQDGGLPATEPLTVWRKLWVENDSMGNVNEDGSVQGIPNDTFGYKRNDLSEDTPNPIINAVTLNAAGTETIFAISPISDGSSFFDLEYGRIIVQSITHPVIGTGLYIDDHLVSVAGDHTSVPIGSGFRLYDDDDGGLDVELLPNPELVNEQMKNYFKTSFVEVTDAAAFNPRKLVTFQRNQDVYDFSSTVVDDSWDLTDKNALWMSPVTVAYQGPEEADHDPAGVEEHTRLGDTAAHGDYDHSTVFVEGCRENYDAFLRNSNPESVILYRARLKRWIVAVAAHEMGHQPAEQTEKEDHDEDELMSEGLSVVSGISPENSFFTPLTVRRFRKSTRWSK
jgi:hypothetical protein